MRIVRLANRLLACSSCQLVQQINHRFIVCETSRLNMPQSSIRSQAELTERLKKKKQLNKSRMQVDSSQGERARFGGKKAKRDQPSQQQQQQLRNPGDSVIEHIDRPSIGAIPRESEESNDQQQAMNRGTSREHSAAIQEKQLRRLEKEYLKNERRLDPKKSLSPDEMVQTESSYLTQATLLKSRLSELDPAGCALLDQMPSLKKSSTDPRHLTIVHDALAKHIAKIIVNKQQLLLKQQQQQQQQQQEKKHTTEPIENNTTDNKTRHHSVFVEFHPGFGLVTKSILQLLSASQSDSASSDELFTDFLLIEPFSKFEKHLNDLSSSSSSSSSTSPHNVVFVPRRKPFEPGFLYNVKSKDDQSRRIVDLIGKPYENGAASVNLTVFGILPWNSKGYLSRLLGDYASDRSLFSFPHVLTTDIYLYVPEFMLAKLKPDFKMPESSKSLQTTKIKQENNNNNYTSSSLSVLAALLADKIDVLDRQPCDYFFPYPMLANPSKYKRQQSAPLVDFNKLALVNIRFDRSLKAHLRDCDDVPADRGQDDHEDDHNYDESTTKQNLNHYEHKRLLYLFVSQVFVKPTQCLKDALRRVCANVEQVCKDNAISPYVPVNSLQPYKFLLIFEYLLKNEDLSRLAQLNSPPNFSTRSGSPLNDRNRNKIT